MIVFNIEKFSLDVRKKYSLKYTCEKIGISYPSLVHALKGKNDFTTGRFLKLCNFLNLNPADYFNKTRIKENGN